MRDVTLARRALNLILPAVALAATLLAVILIPISASVAPSATERRLAAAEITIASGGDVLPSDPEIGDAIDIDSADSGEVTSEPGLIGQISTSVEPRKCAATIWIAPDPEQHESITGYAFHGARYSAVGAQVLVMANRASARAAFDGFVAAYEGCDRFTYRQTDLLDPVTETNVTELRISSGGIPFFEVVSEATFTSDETDYEVDTVNRFYLVGNAVFNISLSRYGADPELASADQLVADFEDRLDALLVAAQPVA